MMNIQKVGTYFFILGVLIAIFTGGFDISSDMRTAVLAIIIITGGLVGLLNIEEEREFHFLLAGGVFIIAASALNQHIGDLLLLSQFKTMLDNLVIFTATACIVVGLKLIFHYASAHEGRGEEEAPEFNDPKQQVVWDYVIFLSVCLAFVIFILEAFFYINGLSQFLEWLSYAIILIFLIDVIILFGRSKNLWSFLKNHWADIVAIIPVAGIFQLAKLFRIAKIARTFSRTSKLARVGKISHSAKFFSKHSGFNKITEKKKRK